MRDFASATSATRIRLLDARNKGRREEKEDRRNGEEISSESNGIARNPENSMCYRSSLSGMDFGVVCS